jgi:site-specific recombinase XerC
MKLLSPAQRIVLCHPVDKYVELRGYAIFAWGYWAGSGVSDISHLRLAHTHVGLKLGWLRVDYKGEKFREIDLLNEVGLG